MRGFAQIGSIRRRLALQLGAVALILSILFFVLVREVAGQAAEATQDNILAASATSIADALGASGESVELELPYSALSMLGAISEDRVFYRVYTAAETLTGYETLPSPEATVAAPVFATFEFLGEEVRAATVLRRVSLASGPVEVFVTVAQTRLGLGAITSRITTLASAIGVGFFIVAVALSLLAAQSGLRPLERLAAAVGRRGPQDMRPVTAEAPAEIAPLVGALNSFMDRLRASLSRSEDFIAEAAHRVRTPLATVRTQAEIALRRVERPENKQALRQMIRAVDESSRSAGQLLDHAMVTFRADHLAREEVDLAELARDAVSRLEPIAALKDIELIWRGPDHQAAIEGDRILLQNALRNILDNAIKYSPEDTTIDVSLRRDAGAWRLAVADQGRGLDGADLAKLSERFARGANVGEIVGSGLGLTITSEVAAAHGGSLELRQREEGGACAVLVFPSR